MPTLAPVVLPEVRELIEPILAAWFAPFAEALVFSKAKVEGFEPRLNSLSVLVRALDEGGDFYVVLDGYKVDGTAYATYRWEDIRNSPFLVSHRALDQGDGAILQISNAPDGQHICWLHN